MDIPACKTWNYSQPYSAAYVYSNPSTPWPSSGTFLKCVTPQFNPNLQCSLPQMLWCYLVSGFKSTSCRDKINWMKIVDLPKVSLANNSLESIWHYEKNQLFVFRWIAPVKNRSIITFILVSNGIFRICTISLAIVGHTFIKD